METAAIALVEKAPYSKDVKVDGICREESLSQLQNALIPTLLIPSFIYRQPECFSPSVYDISYRLVQLLKAI